MGRPNVVDERSDEPDPSSVTAPSPAKLPAADDPPLLGERDVLVVPRRGGRALCAQVARPAGAVLVRFDAALVRDAPTMHTIQLGPDKHIELSPDFLRFVNHACDPSVAFDVERLALVALRDLAAGDELTYFYPSTEWRMAEPFECQCRSARCLGRITGAADTDPAVLARYPLAPWIRSRLGIA